MSARLQNLYNEYSKREGVIESNQRALAECIEQVKVLKANITGELLDIVNTYEPNLLDVIDEERFNNLENVEEFKKSLEYVIGRLFTFLESELL